MCGLGSSETGGSAASSFSFGAAPDAGRGPAHAVAVGTRGFADAAAEAAGGGGAVAPSYGGHVATHAASQRAGGDGAVAAAAAGAASTGLGPADAVDLPMERLTQAFAASTEATAALLQQQRAAVHNAAAEYVRHHGARQQLAAFNSAVAEYMRQHGTSQQRQQQQPQQNPFAPHRQTQPPQQQLGKDTSLVTSWGRQGQQPGTACDAMFLVLPCQLYVQLRQIGAETPSTGDGLGSGTQCTVVLWRSRSQNALCMLQLCLRRFSSVYSACLYCTGGQNMSCMPAHCVYRTATTHCYCSCTCRQLQFC